MNSFFCFVVAFWNFKHKYSFLLTNEKIMQFFAVACYGLKLTIFHLLTRNSWKVAKYIAVNFFKLFRILKEMCLKLFEPGPDAFYNQTTLYSSKRKKNLLQNAVKSVANVNIFNFYKVINHNVNMQKGWMLCF